MVERVKFDGIEEIVVVDVKSEHPNPDFGKYSFVEHKAIVGFESDDGRSVSDVRSLVGNHFFECSHCFGSGKDKTGY